MSGSRKTIDARGLPCPQPVVLAKKAIEAGGFDELEILVDNEAARENVLRFALYAGLSAQAFAGEGATRRVVMKAAAGEVSDAGQTAGQASSARASSSSGSSEPGEAGKTAAEGAVRGREYPLTVFIPADVVGKGDDKLGRLLMRGFTYALTEGADLPARVVLMNSGVRLAIDGSDSLDHLKKLAGFGVEVLACGTCLEFYGLKDKLAVGRVSNMYEIAEALQAGRTLTV